ncbi:15602_t:CDS:2, partial [Acaulospora colombiana]
IILGLAASFGGLALYVEAGWIRQAPTTTSSNEKAGTPEDQSADTRIGWKIRDRPVLEVLCIMGATHAAGLATLAIRKDLLAAIDLFSIPSLGLLFVIWLYSHILYPNSPDDAKVQEAKASKIKIKGDGPVTTPLTPLFSLPDLPPLPPTTSALLKGLSLCTLGAIISVTAVANFSLSVTMAVLSALPLCLVPVSLHHPSETPEP